MNKKSFTLIELLVVIAIIGLLSTVVMVSVGGFQKNARDAKRKSDLAEMKKALEIYFLDNQKYPVHSTWIFSTAGDNWIPELVGSGVGKFKVTPKDPVNNGVVPWTTGGYRYAYRSTNDGQRYDLVTQLENKSDSDRCEKKCYIYHFPGARRPWCSSCANGYRYSNYMYADH